MRSRRFRSPLSFPLRLALLALLAAPSCGGGGGPAPAAGPFTATAPPAGPGGAHPAPLPLPPPDVAADATWTQDAVPFGRTALFGSFPSDVVRFGSTIFSNDGDAIEGDGAAILAIDVSSGPPEPSSRYATTVIHAQDLVDSHGNPGDAAHPIGFGFYMNDILVASDGLAFALASAGGSDSNPACSNLVVFDPTSGAVRQVVDLATTVPAPGTGLDSTGTPVPGGAFRQSGAEGLAYVPGKAGAKGIVLVAMSNFVFGAPSYGAVKYPGTVEVFDVDPSAAAPVSARTAVGLATQVLVPAGYNPVAVSLLENFAGSDRLLVTVAGTTGYDASGKLVPVTPASVEAYDASTLAYLGRFDLGLAGLSAARPALGHDAVGHSVGYFASSVRGEVYLLRLDGLLGSSVDASRVAVLRGPGNGIAIDPAHAGGPGGNVAGLALSAAGDVLLASGFGDFYAFPAPAPGRLFALSLPADVVGSASFPREFVPGTSNVVTTPGRTLGPVVIAPAVWGGPEVYVAVSGSLDPATFLGSSPASLGSLDTHGKIR